MTKDIIKIPVKKLKVHPRQAALFNDLPSQLLKDLAEDIKIRGLKEPIEILPDLTIVCGHQRVGAAILLGWSEIDGWINYELATQGDLAVEQRLIEDNLARRHLTKLDQVRCYKRLQEMVDETPSARLRTHQKGRLRDIVGQRLCMSGR